MDAAEHARLAVAWLNVSDEEFAEGRRMQASEKLWGAASHALTAVAIERGWRYGRHAHFDINTRRLVEESGNKEMLDNFNMAQRFHANFYQGHLDDAEIAEYRPLTRSFVRFVLNFLTESPYN